MDIGSGDNCHCHHIQTRKTHHITSTPHKLQKTTHKISRDHSPHKILRNYRLCYFRMSIYRRRVRVRGKRVAESRDVIQLLTWEIPGVKLFGSVCIKSAPRHRLWLVKVAQNQALVVMLLPKSNHSASLSASTAAIYSPQQHHLPCHP